MADLIDIPTTVNALVSFFALGGTDTALEIAKGVLSNASLKVADFMKLKDELLSMQDVVEQIRAVQQQPQDNSLQTRLKEMLTQKLEQHSTFNQQTAVQVQGDIKATEGGVAVAVNNKVISMTNTFKD